MNAAAVLRSARADGLKLAVSEPGAVKLSGSRAAVDRWMPAIASTKPDIVALLRPIASHQQLQPLHLQEAKRLSRTPRASQPHRPHRLMNSPTCRHRPPQGLGRPDKSLQPKLERRQSSLLVSAYRRTVLHRGRSRRPTPLSGCHRGSLQPSRPPREAMSSSGCRTTSSFKPNRRLQTPLQSSRLSSHSGHAARRSRCFAA
jgi:hypothetical protein